MSRDPKTDQALALLRKTVLAYTRHGEFLETTATRLTTSINLTIQAHRDDHPKLVGQKGLHIIGLQKIFEFVGRGIGVPIRVMLLDPCRGDKMALDPFKADPNWKANQVLPLMDDILDCVMRQPYKLDAVPTHGTTTLEIVPDMNERLKLFTEAGEKNDFTNALNNIFHAIGKGQGRILYVEPVDPKIYANS